MFDRKSLIIRLSMVLSLALVVGCSDDETTVPAADTGTDTTADAATDTPMEDTSADTPMEDTSADTPMEDTSADTSADTPMEDTSGDTATAEGDFCTNETDLPIVTSEDLDEETEGEQTVTSIAQDCGLGCLGDPDDPRQCSIDCIVEATAISNDCAGCYGDTVACSIENCLEAFYFCTGLPSGEEEGGE